MQAVSRISFPPPPVASTPLKGNRLRPEAAPVQQAPAVKESPKASGLWEGASFGFRDFIDMINPLQHLPVISTIYRKLTGDEIGAAPRMIGGAIFGGLLGSWISGLASAVANVFSRSVTGKDIGDHLTAYAQPERKTETPPGPAATPAALSRRVDTADHILEPGPGMSATAGFASVREISQPLPVQQSSVASPPTAVQQSGGAARAPATGAYGQVQVALEQYRQQIRVDDISRDTHYWA